MTTTCAPASAGDGYSLPTPTGCVRWLARFLTSTEGSNTMRQFASIALVLLAACRTQESTHERLAGLTAETANLFEIRLPAGDSGSINVGWFNNGATRLDPRTWLSQGYDGVKFVGQGVDVTHLRCTSWDGITVAVIQHDGIVQLENLTLHTGYNQGTQFGEQNLAKKLSPKFCARLVNCKVVADRVERSALRVEAQQSIAPDAATIRPKWLVFGYQCDLVLDRVVFQGKQAVEHDVYFHGFARDGALVTDCDFQSAGAEGFKVRSDRNETVAVPGTSIVIRRTKFTDWHQDWSWRGGAAIVLQGGASNVLIDECFFRGGQGTASVPSNARSHAIEIVAEDNSWGGTYGNGHVWIRRSAMNGHSDVEWSNSILRVARNSGSQMAARSVTVERCGIYGAKMLVVIGQVPPGKAVVRDCNTPAIKGKCSALFDTSEEATIPTSSRRVPVSEGRVW